jgi:hypothetical protein
MNAAVLAAQEGNDRVAEMNAEAAGNNVAPAGDLSSQVTFDGSLGVDFGTAGPAMGGGYSFLSGTDLQTAFKVAFGAKMSGGEAIDTFSMNGDTMTGSTSGPNAHDVFNLSLDPGTGMFSFQLVGPIDQPATKGSYSPIYLQGLFQATNSSGQAQALPTVEMDVYNDYGAVQSQGNWALLHEASLTYQPPSAATASASSSSTTSSGSASTSSTSGSTTSATTYTPPTDPMTGYAYTANASAAMGVINSVNIFS